MRTSRKILSVFFCCILMVGMVFLCSTEKFDVSGIFANQASATSSGKCGDNLTWTLDENGIFTISGTGAMTDYDSVYVPWCSLKDSIQSAVIENGVTSIGEYTFSFCDNLICVTIGNSVANVGDFAFYECFNLNKVNYTGTIDDWCDINFSYSYGNPIHYGKNFYINGSLVTDIVISNSVENIKSETFRNCESIKSVSIGNGVKSIGEHAFESCSSLTSITIPDSITSIGWNAFSGCTGLTSITIPDGVKAIEYGVFEGCSGLRSISIPKSVKYIEGYAFYGCYNLSDVYYGGNSSDRELIAITQESYGTSNTNAPLTVATWHYDSDKSDVPAADPVANIKEADIIKGNSGDNKKTYEYKTAVTFTANVPEGGSVQWYINDSPAGNEATLSVGAKDKSYTVKVVVTDSNGNKTADTEQVTIKNSLWDKIVYFFKHLFNPGAYTVNQ